VAEFGDHVRMPMRGKLSPEEIRTIQRRIGDSDEVEQHSGGKANSIPV